jgi:mono/diheme cytochrome c family protein
VIPKTLKPMAAPLSLGLVLLAALALGLAAEAKRGGQETPTGTKAQTPSFVEKSKIPASGKQGPPGEAASLVGDPARGATLFGEFCAACHGAQGTDKVPNPGSDDGTVPPLNPIDPHLANPDPALFAANIDRIIQHGSVPDGPDPRLVMPDWGDSQTLSQQQIADLEAYIMHLNGVNRRPGVSDDPSDSGGQGVESKLESN